MELDQLFAEACQELKRNAVEFAVAGGLAATIYRAEMRLTADVDFILAASGNVRLVAQNIIRSLGLTALVVRQAELAGGPLFAIKRKTSPPYIVVGRDRHNKNSPGLDFILPAMPWVTDALGRAQRHLIDFGFGGIPTMTVEDVLIAKFFALRAANLRPKDEDDVLSIFAAQGEIDFKYLTGQMRKFGLALPRDVRQQLPKLLRQVSKDIERDLRAKHRPPRAKT